MRKAEAASTKDCPVKIGVVACPLCSLTIQTLDKEQGISVLNQGIAACSEEIQRHKGKLILKKAPCRVVSEREERLLAEQIRKLGNDNEELSGEEDSGEDEDEDDD